MKLVSTFLFLLGASFITSYTAVSLGASPAMTFTANLVVGAVLGLLSAL